MNITNREHFDHIVHWPISNKVKRDVIEKMDFRAQVEHEEFLRKRTSGANIRDIHKEAISRGERYKDILGSIIRSLNIPDNSVCADLGAGTATFAALMALQDNVRKVYAVEISEQFTINIMPITFDHFKVPKDKIVRIVGDFNSLEFEDNSLDFTVETGSFHHSEDIDATLSECFRVLKPGGFLLAVERARFNCMDASKKDAKLDKELSNALKIKYGIPLGTSYTRRMWGEHEITFGEWNSFFKKAGFRTKMAMIKPYGSVQPLKFLLNKFCSLGDGYYDPFYPGQNFQYTRLGYELLKIPIFICLKPSRND